MTGDVASPADRASDHAIRHLASLEEYRACVALQEEVWGQGFSERVPTAILKVGQELGGVSAGAFDRSGRLDGFVFGLTGLDGENQPVHWSDMLAVRSTVAGRGLASRLKWFQRQAVLDRGVGRMLWTFDPLRARNAHLNLNKLGAVVREYRENMYGDTDSELHRGIGTDRFLALWRLDSPRVARRAAAGAMGRAGTGPEERTPTEGDASADPLEPVVLALETSRPHGGPDPRPGARRLELDAPRIGVPIPSDIGAVMDHDGGLAVAWREATREVLVHYLKRGYEVTELIGGDDVVTYVLEARSESPGDAR